MLCKISDAIFSDWHYTRGIHNNVSKRETQVRPYHRQGPTFAHLWGIGIIKLISNTLVSYSTITTVGGLVTFLWQTVAYQRYSQNTANSMQSTPWAHDISDNFCVKCRATRAVQSRGIFPQKSVEFLSFPGQFWGYFNKYCCMQSLALWPCLWYKPLHSVKPLYSS